MEKLGPGSKVIQKQIQTIDKTDKMTSVIDIKNSYDENGNLKQAKQTTISIQNNKKFKSTLTETYEYDENNKLKRTVSKGKDKTGKPTASVTEYENGQKVRKHSKFYQKGSLTETITDFRQSAAGLPQTKIVYGKDGKTVQEKIENTFDEEGILSAQKRTDANGNVVTYDYSKLDGKFDIGNQQNMGDCYLLASINALRETPEGQEMLQKTVKNNGDGTYTITFPGAKITREALINGTGGKQITLADGTKVDSLPEDKVFIQESITITEDELKAALKQQGQKYSVGDRDVVLLELGYQKYREAADKTMTANNVAPGGENGYIPGIEVPAKRHETDNVLASGKTANAMFILTGHQSKLQYQILSSNKPNCYINSNMQIEVTDDNGFLASAENAKALSSVVDGGFTNNIDDLISKVQQDCADGKLDEYAVATSFNVSSQEINGEVLSGGGHAFTITKIDDKNVYMRNPWDPAKEISMSIQDFKRAATSMNIMPLKEALTAQQVSAQAAVQQAAQQIAQQAAQQTTQQTAQQTTQQAAQQTTQQTAQQTTQQAAQQTAQQAVQQAVQQAAQQTTQQTAASQPANADNKPNYQVKKGEGYTAIIKQALQDQGIEPTKENIQKAKAQFEQANPGAVHVYNGKKKAWHGNKFLYTDANVFIPQFKI